MEQNRINLYQGLVKDGKYTKDFDSFTTKYFSNENTVKFLWSNLLQDGDYTKTLKDFYSKYCCDLGWASNLTFCGGSQTSTQPKKDTTAPTNPNQPNNNNFPSCALKKGKVRKTPSGAEVIVFKTSVWDKPSIQLYAKTNRFMVLDGSKKGKKGNYKCTQSGKLFLELDSEKKVDSKKDEKKKQSSGFTNTNLTLDDILKGKGSVKMGMKGPVVGEIQNILIKLNQSKVSKSGKADNVFGKLTDLAVRQFQGNNMSKGEQDGVVGQRTLKRLIELRDYNGGTGMGDDSPEFLQAQLDAQKSQLPVNHGKRQLDDSGNTFVWDGYNQVWLSDSDYLNLYNTDGTKKLQENIIKNIVIKNLHSLL